MAMLSNNGMVFRHKMLNEVCDQFGIKRLFANPYHPQGNAMAEIFILSLKGPSQSS